MQTSNRYAIPALLVAAALLLSGVNVLLSAQEALTVSAPTNIAGEWRLATDERDISSQAPLGDYTGIAFNAAGRMRSETTPESIWGTAEFQCRPHSAPHQWRGLGGARILEEQDPLTRQPKVYHVQFMRSLDRPIFMDGRPHPPAYAPHSWTGFSTGEWIGNTLKVTTTHLKDGFLRRGGPQTTDMYDDDGVHHAAWRHPDDRHRHRRPAVPRTSRTSTRRPTRTNLNTRVTMETCSGSFAENGGTDRHHVPHFLPGTNEDALNEWIKASLITGGARNVAPPQDWVPLQVARGGVKTMYPEYRATLNGSVSVDSLTVPASRSVVNPQKLIADQSPRDGEVHVLPVQGNVFMLVADGTNITASLGPEGIMLVNAGPASMSDKIVAAVNDLAKRIVAPTPTNSCFGANCPGMWGWSIRTSTPSLPVSDAGAADPLHRRHERRAGVSAGNAKLVAAGSSNRNGGFGAAVEAVEGASVVAHENVLNRMSDVKPAPAAASLPTVTYFDDFYKFPAFFNGESVIAYYAPESTTDGDSYVYFRRSDVIATGDVFSSISYPKIDLAKGGSVQGEIRALNAILDLAVAEYRSQGGTWIVPGHGRLSDVGDVASYRNMVVIDSRPHSGRDQEGKDARAGESGEAHARLRPAVGSDHRCVDHGYVRRGRVQESAAWKEVMCRFLILVATVLVLAPPLSVAARQAGRGAAAAPPTARSAAALDLTGYWVSVIVEDWKWRMVTPNKGVYEAIPLNADARKVADAWDPAKDEAAGEQCRWYGAANLMRVPGRLPHHVGERQHIAGRHRLRHPDAPVPLRRRAVQ